MTIITSPYFPTFDEDKTMRHEARGNFIDAQWICPDDAEIWRRENPARIDDTVMELPWSTQAVDEAVASARSAQKDWARRPIDDRLRFLARFRDALEARQDELARAICLEMGKPLWEALGEARALTKKIDIMTDEGLRFTAPVHPEGLSQGSWRYRPLGVLAIVGPYNFPLHLPNGHLVPALATGNSVVVKPSEFSPLSMQLYFQCLQEADFPAGVVNLVQGPGPVGAGLSAHPDVDGVLFTGSYRTGLRIKKATIEQPSKLLALEMGGKNTTIVLDDADLEQALCAITESACLTTGQRCSATSRVVVHSHVADDLIDGLRDLFERTTTGDPLNDDPLMGPLATKPGFRKFVDAQQDDEGGNLTALLRGGAHPDYQNGYFVRPALWHATTVDPGGSHQADEIFGPDVIIYTVRDDREAIDVANATDYGLAMSVFTADEERFDDMAHDLEAGILNLNRSTVGASSRLPFGGIKKSGNHRPAAILAGLYCTYPVASLRTPPQFDPSTVAEGPLSRLREEG